MRDLLVPARATDLVDVADSLKGDEWITEDRNGGPHTWKCSSSYMLC